MKSQKGKRRSRKLIRLVSIFGLLFFAVCGLEIHFKIPASCGGEGEYSVFVSPIIDYTSPPNGMFIRQPQFTTFTINFLQPVYAIDDPDILTSIELYRTDNYWDPNEEEYQNEDPVVLGNVFTDFTWSRCENLCGPDIPQELKDQLSESLTFAVNSGALLQQQGDNIFRFRFVRACSPEVTEDCTDTPFTAYTPDGDYQYDNDTNIIIGIVPGNAPTEMPIITWDFLDEARHYWGDYWTSSPVQYIPPHQKLRVHFSKEMGFINYDGIPDWGFYFGLGSRSKKDSGQYQEYSTLESDSRQGLTPGKTYSLYIKSSDTVPDTMRMNIPFTMDRFGNPLAANRAPYDDVETELFENFTASHVRITFPFHAPFSKMPDKWHLYPTIHDPPYISVEVTPSVATLRTTDPNGMQVADFAFPDQTLPEGRTENVIITIDEGIDILRGSDGYPSTIHVHAYDKSGNWLGADVIELYAYKPAPKNINIVTYNSWGETPIVGDDLTEIPECKKINDWPLCCHCLFMFGGDPESCEGSESCPTEECFPYPGYCFPFLTFDFGVFHYVYTIPETIDWEMRLLRFARDIVCKYQPAIIVMQHVELRKSDCGKIKRGEYLGHLLDSINNCVDEKDLTSEYYLANVAKANFATVCKGTCCFQQWEGYATIYDKSQVRFIPSWPLYGQTPEACRGWYKGHEEYYDPELGYLEHTDCMVNWDHSEHAEATRAIFEFPIESNHFFNLYNYHATPATRIPRLVDFYISNRESSFLLDMEEYFPQAFSSPPSSPGRVPKIYPPVLAGDMNTAGLEWETNPDHRAIRDWILLTWQDAPTWGAIDKVWAGVPEAWDHDAVLEAVETPADSDEYVPYEYFDEEKNRIVTQQYLPPFLRHKYGFSVSWLFRDKEPYGLYQIYTDHSPSMVEIQTLIE